MTDDRGGAPLGERRVTIAADLRDRLAGSPPPAHRPRAHPRRHRSRSVRVLIVVLGVLLGLGGCTAILAAIEDRHLHEPYSVSVAAWVPHFRTGGRTDDGLDRVCAPTGVDAVYAAGTVATLRTETGKVLRTARVQPGRTHALEEPECIADIDFGPVRERRDYLLTLGGRTVVLSSPSGQKDPDSGRYADDTIRYGIEDAAPGLPERRFAPSAPADDRREGWTQHCIVVVNGEPRDDCDLDDGEDLFPDID